MHWIERQIVRMTTLLGLAILKLPNGLLRILGGPRPKKARELHPEAWMLAVLARTQSVVGNRDSLEKAAARMETEAAVMGGRGGRDVATEDRELPGPGGSIPVRLYTPPGAAATSPLLVYFHGGGWVRGSIDSHDSLCRRLAGSAAIRVLSVDYRLAPEHPFPAAADDCEAVYDHVVANPAAFGADPRRIAVGGDSAGGNLAAVVAVHARDAGLPEPALQLLIYPATDLHRRMESHRTYAKGYYLTVPMIDTFLDSYTPDVADRDDPRASVIETKDFSGLAPAYVITAHADPLRDEGERYAELLRDAGVDVEFERAPFLHGFVNLGATPGGRAEVEKIAARLRRRLA